MNENYILTYYQAIMSGAESVGRWIRLWYILLVKGLENKLFFYDAKKAGRAIKFIERYCHHHEGAAAPGTIVLELWQKALICTLFGVMDGNGFRQFREVVVIIGRKNGKTLLAAAIAAYAMYLDGEYGARVYFCAPKLDQARLCFDGLYQMILKEPDMSEITKKRRTDLYVAESNTSAMPIAFSAKKSDGLNPHLTVCDEIAAWHGEAGLRQYEVLQSALGARKQPILISISTSGYENDSIYDELMKRCTAVINGTSGERRLLPLLYMIDDVDKWNDINELKKANPNLGVSVSVDYMLEEIAVAESSYSRKVEFLTKHCNIKQNSSQSWLSAQTVAKGFGNHYTLEDFRGSYALAGLDLSQTTDLTAAIVLIQRGETIYYFTHFWMPSEKVEEATARDGVPYRKYIERGFLSTSGDNFVDYQDCYRWFTDLIEKYEIYPLKLGYDRYSSQYLIQALNSYGMHTDSVFQGTNLTGIINNAEGLLKDGTLQCADDNDLMRIHLLDSAMQVRAENNQRKLIKVHAKAHVDGVAALLDALCMRQVYWGELGEQLKNAG